ncbi:GNAT family N-acetyltransferase [Hoeflea prorocentri]|uniref:GNAT family N-acetyltransferase n=1 Tax=Hoeflea prorocentri TaxID=1922333 RepID=A0A9X3ZHX6_9HYPH|nr:GNAT family N-acetyltransferase [Hoeflea prorocentri]MCY6382302.1 GNAT family N-acetyltransferase [Hoeflea prorocentri]MDA5400102.1 GNAT family N-acetyltransferase [Hoeflea prorocentri]
MTRHVTLRHLQADDLPLLLKVEEGLFDNPIDPAQAAAFLSDPLHELVLAFDGDLAVGMASGCILLHPDKKPSMFVNEVGVRDSHLRQGIGRAVTEKLFEIARARGCQGIWLGTEADNGPALALYRKLRGDELKGVYFGWDGAFDEG